jgi:hypothetical protein
MSINRKRGSIALARQLCYDIAGATSEDDDISGSDYGSVDVAEILSAEVERLREALAQPEQEPVAWRIRCTDPMRDWVLMYRYPKTEEQFSNEEIQPLYTTPPAAQRPWQGLTDEEVWEAYMESPVELDCSTDELYALSRTVEAKLKGKNYG